MNCNFNTFALSKKFVLVDNIVDDDIKATSFSKNAESATIPAMIQCELMSYGKSLTERAFASLVSMSVSRQKQLAYDVKEYLMDLYGNYGTFDSLFGNFPETVLGMSDVEIALHTICEYFTNGAYFPKDYMVKKNDTENSSFDFALCVKDHYEMIDAIDKDGLAKIYKNIITANQSLTDWDQEAIVYLGNNLFPAFANVMDTITDIPFKETLCLCIDALDYSPKTITDVLRYAVFLSGGDVALPSIPTFISNGWKSRRATKEDNQKYNFVKFKRSERKKLLQMCENVFNKNYKSACEDLKRFEIRWIRLMEILHIGEFKNRFPSTFKAITTLRENARSIKTWGSRVDEARKALNWEGLKKLYSERPGELGRAYDAIIRKFGETEEVLNLLSDNLSKISMKLLYEISEHFAHRHTEYTRSITAKGKRTPTTLPTLAPLTHEFVAKILQAIIYEMVRRHSQKESLEGHTFYLSESLENIMLPTNMRSANISALQIARGSRLPLPANSDLVRFYCHWIDPDGRDDLDLSASFVNTYSASDPNRKTSDISWRNSYGLATDKGEKYAIFSGDCRLHKGNSAEYIDISISKALEVGWKYVLISVSDFEGKSFRNAYCGYMARTEFGTPGEKTWSPKTVENEMKITPDTGAQIKILGIVDLEKREFIFIDEDKDGIPVATANVNTFSIVDRFVNPTNKKFWNVFKTIMVNIESRGGKTFKMSEKEILDGKAKHNYAAEMLRHDLVAFSNTSGPEASNERVECVAKNIELLSREHFISYEDLVKDYTFIFEYMF